MMLNRDETIRMAHKAGGFASSFTSLWVLYTADLERFAALAYEAGAAAERFACAKEREELVSVLAETDRCLRVAWENFELPSLVISGELARKTNDLLEKYGCSNE